MAKTDTLVLSFGEVAQTAYGKILVEIDPLVHADEDGNVKNRFAEGEDVSFLISHDSGVAVVRVKDTAGGDVQRLGEVSRNGLEERVTFTDPTDVKTLSHIPSGLPVGEWYGRNSSLIKEGQDGVKAETTPCLGDLAYSYKAMQYQYRPPAMNIAMAEEFPVDLVIEYKEAGV